nr:hypothetical protein [Tanacetum cinerariifolium]
EKSHDPLVLVAHTGSSPKTTSPYYATHPSSVVDYDKDYQGDALQNNSEDPLTSAMILLAHAITHRFSNPTNNRLRNSSNTRTQANVQGDRVNIQSRSSSNDGRNTRRSYVQEEIIKAKQDEVGVTLTDEHNNFLFADASRMEEIEELNANICLMARIQPLKFNSDEGTSYDFAFLSEGDRKARQFKEESRSQLIHDRDIIRDLEQQRDKLELFVVELKRQIVELQKTQIILKRKISENEDKYHDTVLDLKARAKRMKM